MPPCAIGADDKPERPTKRYTEPNGQTIVHEGVEYKAFTLPEWKIVGHIFLDHDALWEYSLSLELDIASYEREIKSWEFRMNIWKEATETERARGDMLSKMFDEEHELRLKIEKQQRVFGWVPWALVVIESIAIGVLGVYSGARLAAVN